MKKVVIIGNGISGITAARHIRKKSDACITVISAETKYFFSRTALMYVYMGHMRFEDTKPYENWFWKKNKIDLIQDFVTHIDYKNQTLTLKNGDKISYDSLILAVGSKPNKFGWPGQDLIGVQGLYSFQDLEKIEENTKNINQAVIVGGGLIGVELAEMLLSRKINVTFLVRENRFWGNILPKEEGELIARHMKKHYVDLRFEEELAEIIGDDSGTVKSIITKKGEEIPCEFVGLTAGVSPNIDFLRNTDLEVSRGILVNEYNQTNFENVFAIGDCAEFKKPVVGRKAIEQVWYTGRIMGETVAETICGNPIKYNPGPWFNSAKFFDIEYQTYGDVKAICQENEIDFYWENSQKELAVHLVWDKNTNEFIGINTFGIRMRHELFDKWLKEKCSIFDVMKNLKSANFDPEFFKRYENEIVESFDKKVSSSYSTLKK